MKTSKGLAAALVAACVLSSAALEAREPVVFVSRDAATPSADARTSVVEKAASGRLLVLETDGSLRALVDSRAPGAPTDAPADVLDPDPSFDARSIVFAGYSQREGAWRIYEIGADGSGLRQVTSSDRNADLERFGEHASSLEGYDDLDPCYLPDGRICFVSTRYSGLAPDERHRATNLFVVNADGSNLHRITTERFGADTPAVEPATGRIVYSRWWRTAQGTGTPSQNPDELPAPGDVIDANGDGRPDFPGQVPPGEPLPPGEPIPPGSPGYGGGDTSIRGIASEVVRSVDDLRFPGVNSWFLAGINPDGTDMRMYTGVRIDREATQAYRPSFDSQGRALALFIPRTPIIGQPGQNGLRRYVEGSELPELLDGPQSFAFSGVDLIDLLGPAGAAGALPPDLPPEELAEFLRRLIAQGAGSGLVYHSVAELPDRDLLVSAALASIDADGQIALDYDLFVTREPNSAPEPLLALAGTHELDAAVLVARPTPPVLSDRVHDRLSDDVAQSREAAEDAAGTFRFVVENIHSNSPVDTLTAGAPPVGKQLSIEFYMAPQGPGASGLADAILLERREIGPDGRVEVELPAGVPLFEVLRRPDGTLAQGRDGQIFHVAGMNFGRAGEEARCVGCHMGHSMMPVPSDPAEIRFTNLASSARVTASSTLGSRQNGRDPAIGADGVPLPEVMPPILIGGGFRPEFLVDRATSGPAAEWIADVEERSHVELEWSVPLQGRSVVVHATRPDAEGREFGSRELTIRRFRVTTLLGEVPISNDVVTTPLEPGGAARIALNPDLPFDRLRVEIESRDLSGLIDGQRVAGLAEIEVDARVQPSAGAPRVSFVRGDADCDGGLTISDPIRILDRLFNASTPLCCGMAADVNADERIDMTDPIFELNFLFLGGREPAGGVRACTSAEESGLLCEGGFCP